ncbi:acyltransferase family protein [Prosthecomicrobium pneumaticum]|uniref:Peptidoglycan/LPS O-acetylase OafA/YrhL n=1 Tax=Prosthecomicrobium pneumaticum TaxID=81895 RepID=A0A7W9L2Y4_9HYPH|nr:acyltransferase family protein [Prosthecomicrobium pneumaticum]MBB5753951.1 peptidoglycan/LPS O-acetylase OafA/YrhL [Prosthecomicrobium pneumaticum]
MPLEGMRGLAALQVVFAHYASVFFPAIARIVPGEEGTLGLRLARSPLFFLLDGGVAVFSFFLMSGFVLGLSFLRSDLPMPRQVAKRFVRLYLPVLAALALALVLLTLWPRLGLRMQVFNGSDWLRGLHLFSPGRTATVYQDVLLNSMLLGYAGASIFRFFDTAAVGLPLVGLGHALDPPLWTLHIEFWGSLLTLAMAQAYRRLRRPAFWAVYALALVATAGGAFSLFLIGFAAGLFRDRLTGRDHAPLRGLFAVLALAGAVALSGYSPLMPFVGLQIEKELAAVLVFGAVLVAPWLDRLLSARPLAWLGGLSFGLYLTHFPILFTLSILLFLGLQPSFGALPAALAATAVGIAVSIGVAAAFEQLVDWPAIGLAARIGSGPPVPVTPAGGRSPGANPR